MAWYDLFYNFQDAELDRAQSFDKDWNQIRKGKKPENEFGRWLVVFINAFILINQVRADPFENIYKQATCWCLWATFFTALMGAILSGNPILTIRQAPHMHAFHHLCYTLMIFMTPAVIILYWTVIHDNHVKYIQQLYKDDPVQYGRAYFHTTYLVHSIPGLCAVYLMFITDAVLIKKHAIGLMVFELAYVIQNFISTHSRGKAVF